MGNLQDAMRAELARMPADVAGSALALAGIDIARRIDADPGDDAAVRLCRELRLVCGELYRRGGEDSTDDVEAFLARVAAPDLGHTAH